MAEEITPDTVPSIANRRSPRVRPEEERVELSLLPQFKPDPEKKLELANFREWESKTDAEIRVFIENEMVLQVKQDFSNIKLSDALLHDLASRAVKQIQVEADLNIERFIKGDSVVLDPKILSERISALAFRYDRFLKSFKIVEDEEEKARKQKELEEQVALRAVNRVISRELPDDKLPTNLVEHMLKVGMEQHLKVVRKYMIGDGEAFGVTVTFKDLQVTRKISTLVEDEAEKAKKNEPSKLRQFLRPGGHQTVWTATSNMLFGCCFAAADHIRDSQRKRKHEISLLKSLNGVIEPGKSTLVLGAPHSGKTQLLHALSGQTKNQGPIRVSGDVYYNGHKYRDLFRTSFCTMVEQIDIHIPTLTVRETLAFAMACRGQGVSSSPEQRKKGGAIAKSKVDLIMAVLGLTRVAETIIGNESIKGISGGEMRRVTLGEMLVVGTKVLMLDEISTGLDSAATFDITSSIRALCRVFNANAIVSLLQPPPETFELFDDVILMSDGNIVYHGPRPLMRDYFAQLNLVPQGNMDFADFLIESSLDNRESLIESYKASSAHQQELEVLAKDPSHLHSKNAHPENPNLATFEENLVKSSRYGKSFLQLLPIVVKRQWVIIIRNRPFIIARVAQNIIMGLLLGALYFNIPFDGYYVIAMVLSQLLNLAGFSTMALLGTVLLVRNVYYKQAKQNFFPPVVYVVADYIVGLPFSIMDAFLLGSITYFMSGMSVNPSGQPYFVFLVIFISYGVCMATLIRLYAYASPNQNVAFALAVFINVFNILFGGAIATPSVIPPYFIWIYWAFSPLAWGYRSLLQNEFYSGDYQEECASGCPNNLQGQCVQYCGSSSGCPQPYPNMTCGEYFLTARQVETAPFFLWLGAGMLWIYTLLFILLSVLSLKFLHWDASSASTLQEDAEAVVGDQHHDDHDAEQQAGKGAAEALQKGFQPKPLIWREIVYTIPIVVKPQNLEDDRPRRTRKAAIEQVDLLKRVTGFAKPYTLTALMGSSGAGKTTLLDCLCYRKTVGKITGTVSLGAKTVIPELFKKEVGYVEQFGVHSEKATVRESLEFSAQLRLDKEYSVAERKQIVEGTLDLLGLRPIENSLVGKLGEADSLSFEENKRVTIAVELVANPSVCFADEPTSGLTSKEARECMKALSRVAASGRPVICTIHQPSAYIFSLFHRLLLLKRGGEVVYFGDLGKNAERLVAYFESIPGVQPLPQGLNPATWMLDVIGAGVGRADKSAYDFAELYRSSDLCKQNDTELELLMAQCEQEDEEAEKQKQKRSSAAAIPVPQGDGDGAPRARGDSMEMMQQMFGDSADAGPHYFNDEQVRLLPEDQEKKEKILAIQRYRADYRTQFQALIHRNFVEYWRTPSYSLVRWVVMLVFALVMGLTFLQQQMGNAAGVQSRVGVINMMLLLTANYNSATIVPFAFSRKALFYREKASNMYASFLYAITLQFVEEPYILVEVVLSVVVFYFLVGMAYDAGAFFIYLFLMYFFVTFATYMGLMWSQAVGSQGAASLLANLVVQLLVLFSGVAMPGNIMPSWMLGFYYISPVRWAMEGLLASQFRVYTQVICNTAGTVYTWTNGTSANPNCPLNSDGTPFAFYLSDVEVNACCSPAPNRPISARAYVFTGYTYPDGVVTLPWLGGTNGYSIDWIGYDFLFLVLVGVLIRSIAIILTQYVSHQLR